MRLTPLPLLAACTLLAACGGGGGSVTAGGCAAGGESRPSFVVMLSDDQERRLAESMPALKAQIGAAGVQFDQAFATTPLCCPSRASILGGRYAHNHRVLSNTLERGSHSGFRDSGEEARSLGPRLRAAGYRTAYVGKYLNGYPGNGWPQPAPVPVPPGWDEWFVPVDTFPTQVPYRQFNYTMIDNGQPRVYGEQPADYFGDVVTQRAVQFIETHGCAPFFLMAGFVSPHHPGTPAPRHAQAEVNLPPDPPSLDEADVSDKPAWVRANPPLGEATLAEYRELQRQRLRSLLGLDESVDAIVAALRRRGVLDRTHVVFLSDNGLRLGEHRLPFGKDAPYEEDLGIPLLWRGPGVASNQRSAALVLNIDLAPTVLALAGVTVAEGEMDGRSLVPLLADPAAPWRTQFLFEHFSNLESNTGRATPNPYGLEYSGLRDASSVYVEYAYGDREFYDLASDPHQLDNRYAALDEARRAELAQRLAGLRGCVGGGC